MPNLKRLIADTMKKRIVILLAACFGVSIVNAQLLPYQDATLSAGQRADDLLSRLTLDEKVSLMMNNSPAIERLGVPQFQWWDSQTNTMRVVPGKYEVMVGNSSSDDSLKKIIVEIN